MKTKNILIAFALLLSSGSSLKAQDGDFSSFFDGFQNTFTNTFSDNPILSEGIRWAMLQDSDIQLKMNAKFDHRQQEIGPFSFIEHEKDGAILAKFDWDNKAMSMYVTESQSQTVLALGATPIDGQIHKAGAHYQFIDKEGYWYVPYEAKPGRFTYIKFNAKKLAVGYLQDMLELSVDLASADLANWLLAVIQNIDIEQLSSEDITLNDILFPDGKSLGELAKIGKEYNSEIQKELEKIIKDLLNKRNAALVGFPVFIHWAFIYSPGLIKSKRDVSEKKFDCYGISNGCTELTVLSGEDKGKSMLFDQFGRLIFIDAKKEGTAQFQYGFDFTVNLPKAYTMDDIMSGKVILPD